MSLRPGELKILACVSKENKSFSELKQETDLDDSILAAYLKNLQKVGLVTRDIDSRKYVAGVQSAEALFLYDILAFLKDQFVRKEKWEALGNSRLNYDSGLCLVVGESEKFNQAIARSFLEPDIQLSLANLAYLYRKLWREFILKELDEKERKTILQYEQALWDSFNRLNKELRKMPENLIDEMDRNLLRPSDLDDLNRWIGFLEKKGLLVSSEEELNQSERDKMSENRKILENEKNLKIYQKYRQRILNMPKTLFLLPSLGFSGYNKLFKSYGLDKSSRKDLVG